MSKQFKQRGKKRRPIIERLELRQMLASDTGRQVLLNPAAQPPVIESVLVRSNEFDPRFATYLGTARLGHADGYLRVENNRPQPLPWAVDAVRMVFSEDVDVRLEDLIVSGVNQARRTPISFTYDPVTFAATWQIPSVNADRLRLNLSNSIQSRVSGKFIDGDRSAGSSESDPFSFQFSALAGDLNGDGFVTFADLDPLRANLLASIGEARYNIYNDANADGFIAFSDLDPLRANLLNSRPNRLPSDPTPNLPPGISKLQIGPLQEDAGIQTLRFDVNSSNAATALQFALTSSNTQLITGNPAIVNAVGNHFQLQLASRPDQFGQSQLTFGVADAAGTSRTTFMVDVAPVNDAPYVTQNPPTVTLTGTQPNRSLELADYFTDVDDAALTYRLVTYDSQLTTATIAGSRLDLRLVAGALGQSEVIVQALDAQGLAATVSVPVVGDRDALELLTELQYALASDQVIEYRGQNTFILTSNFNEASRIAVHVENDVVLSAADVTITALGNGQHRVIVRHTSEDYGLSLIQFAVEGEVFAEVAALVLPATEIPVSEFSNTTYAYSQQIRDDGVLELKRTFNDRYLAAQVKARVMSAESFFNMTRPTTSLDMFAAYSIEGSSVSIESSSSQTRMRQSGRVSYTAEVPLSDMRVSPKLKDSYGGRFTENALKEIFDQKDLVGSGLNIAGNALTAVGLTWAIMAGSPIAIAAGTIAIGAATLGTVTNAYLRTEFETDPGKFDGPDELADKLSQVDLAVGIAGIASMGAGWLDEAIDLAVAPGVRGFISNVVNTFEFQFADAASNMVNFVLLSNSLQANRDDAFEIARQQAADLQQFYDSLTFTTEQLVQDASSITAAISQNVASGNQSFFSPDDIDSFSNATALLQSGKSALIEAREALVNEEIPKLPAIPPDALPNTVPQSKNSAAQGENGDRQEKINRLLQNVYQNSYPKLTSVLSAGKKLLDISKTVQSIVGQVGQLFENAANDQYAYTDHDGQTYNLYVAQRGDSARRGTAGRDIINTSYLNDEVYAFADDDRISTLEGNDLIEGGAGRNTYFAGAGNDTVIDGPDGSYISAGPGDDTIYPGGGSDLIESGTGHDTIIFAGTNLGNNTVADPSRSGVLKFTSLSINQLSLRKDKYDLEIFAPSSGTQRSNSVRLVDFFQQDAAGWILNDAQGNSYSLYELTGRITSYEALEVAFARRPAAGTPVFPQDVQYTSTVTSQDNQLRAHLAQDRRLIGANSDVSTPGLVIAFEANESLSGWLNQYLLGGFSRATQFLSSLIPTLNLQNYERITVVGIGAGGLTAQWFGAIAATRGAKFIDMQLINAPDISGLISQVVRSDVNILANDQVIKLAAGFPEYVDGYPVLSTTYLVDPRDWIPRIGIWSGNDETYASWKSFSFDPAASIKGAPLPLIDLELIHKPTEADFTQLDIVDLQLAQVRGIVSFNRPEDFDRAFANIDIILDGQNFDSTTNARWVLTGGGIPTELPEFDLDDDTRADRLQFLSLMRADPSAVDPNARLFMRFDFQAGSQLGEHLAPFYSLVTEHTLYVPEATVPGKFGWNSVVGVRAGEDRGRASALERDSLRVQDATFMVDLTGPGAGPGTYNVSITFGDREEIQESLHVLINGYQADRVSTMPGDFLTRTYQVNVTEPQLRLSFLDTGGNSDYFSINGLTIEKVNYRSFIEPTEALDNDPSVVIITQSYELPETSPGIEIYKEALKAAAMAALTAGAGALLQAAGPLGGTIAQGLGGGFKAGAMAAQASAHGATHAIANAIGSAAVKAAGMSLVTSVPQNLIPSPTARGILAAGTSIFFAVRDIRSAAKPTKYLDASLNLVTDPRDLLGITNGVLKVIEGGLQVANTSAAAMRGQLAEGSTAPWIYEVVNALATMSQQFRLGKLDAAFVPVDLERVEAAIAAGKTPKQILKQWQGSRQFLVLDWVPTRDTLTQIDVDDHLEYVRRTSRVLKQLLAAYAEQIQESSPEAQLDLLFIGHGAGYEINRETVNRLNVSDVADAFDYVKFVTLDPYASSRSAFTWNYPEMTNMVDRVDNIFQTTEVDSSIWVAAAAAPIVLIGTDLGGSELYHGGSDIGPLDGRIGGGSAGMYNGQARIFDLATNKELLRFRPWDTNSVTLSTAELTDIEFSPDGSLVAASGMDGMVTVRYVDDVPDPDSLTGSLLHAAGDVKFVVWGQESNVRSVAFIQLQVDGLWKDYLLTVSAARNPANNIDKNKVLLTDVQTGLPVWQGLDVAGTQVEASPSGLFIVSTDSRGQAKIWKRVPDTLTYAALPNLVAAHTGTNADYIADVQVINDSYFVTAGLDKRMKLFRITDAGATLVQTFVFDNPTEGPVRNLDYDPYNGLLAVASGQELSLWKFDQALGALRPFAPSGQTTPTKFSMHDHVDDIQGIAFSKPSFLLDAQGRYRGDRTVVLGNGTEVELPRRPAGDIDLQRLPAFLSQLGLTSSFAGLKLLTGGEDRTLFLYTLDSLNIGSIREEQVLSGSMLPIREVTLSPDGRRVAVVGRDNIDGDEGGPVKDIDVTSALDDRLGWKFSELFLQGRREHNAVPQQYIYDVIQEKGESYFWLRNSRNANRPGALDKARNLALPPNKRDNIAGVDIAPIDLYLRPGQQIEILPLQWLLEVDRQDYAVNQSTLVLGNVVDQTDPNRIIGSIKLKRSDSGQLRPNIFVFEAADNLDYTNAGRIEFRGHFQFDITGPNDLDGNPREIQDATITFRIINHKPTAYRDVVNLHPNRQVTDLRPRANDYDFDNDDFAIIPVNAQWQPLLFGTEQVARYRRHPDPDDARGVDIETLVDEARLAELIALQASQDVAANRPVRNYLSIEFEYKIQETKYKSISTGIVEVRLQLQAGPTNVRFSELGADQVLIQWDPVSWSADKYVIQRYEEGQGWIKHSPNSDINGNQSDSLRIRINPNTDYWFRVLAKNTDTGREHASYEGNDKTQALHVPATAYVGPASVAMESLGPAQMEVRWEKVYWDVDRYRIDLHQLVVDENGLPLRNTDGNYQYVFGKSQFNVVQAGQGLRTTFKGLLSSQPYLAIVTAKNTAGTVEMATVAAWPVFTGERQLPAAINFERIGPEQVRISWGTVGYAAKYNVVAIDPVTLARVASKMQDADNSRSTNQLVLTGLSASTSYAIIVEAKTKKTGEWIRLIDTDQLARKLPNRDISAGEIAGTLNAGITAAYIIPPEFSHSIATPSLQGLFVGAEFTLLNFARQSVNLIVTDGSVQFPSGNSNLSSLSPAFGEAGTGLIIYRFVAREAFGQPGTMLWEVQIGDELSETRVLHTPTFLAAQPQDNGHLLIKSDQSLPKRLQIDWITPFWDVNRHKIEILYFNPVTQQTSTVPGVPAKTLYLSELTGIDRTHTFTGLTPATQYLVRLTTTGSRGTYHTERLLSTDPQSSPTDFHAHSEKLKSIMVQWSPVAWAAKAYRVSLAKIGANGQPDESTRFYRGASTNTSKLVDDLEMGVEYSYSVETQNNEDEWIANANIKRVKTLTFQLPPAVFVTSPSNGPKRIELDWSSLFTTQTTGGFNFGADSIAVRWRPAGTTGNGSSQILSGTSTGYMITGLERGNSYEVWLDLRANGISQPLQLRTRDNLTLSTQAATPPTAFSVSEVTRGSFRISWNAPEGNDHDWYKATVSLDNGATWVNVERANGETGNQIAKDATTVILSKYQLPSGLFTSFKANVAYRVRLAAVYDGGESREFTSLLGEPVTTADYSTPQNVSASDATLTALRVSWNFDDPIGDPDHFDIQASLDGGNTWLNFPGQASPALRSKTISGLDPTTTYRFRVKAEYPSGVVKTSAASSPVSTLVLPLGLNSISVTGKQNVIVFWPVLAALPTSLFFEVRAIDNSGTPLEAWRIPEGGVIATMTRTFKLIEGLRPGARQEIRLVSTNALGQRNEGAALDFVTPAYPAIELRSPTLPTAQGITLWWTRLETLDSEAQVTDNYVEIFLGGTLISRPRVGSGSGAQHSLVATGLSAGMTYEYQVVAYGGAIKLSQSAVSEFSTLIEGLSVDLETPISARANWTQFAGANATDYRVRALVPGTNTVVSQNVVNIGTAFRRTTIDGLAPSTNYEMIVEVLRNQTVLAYSNRAPFTTLPADLRGVRTTDIRRFSIDVAWDSVGSWATWTKVQWRKVGTSTWSGSGELAGTRTSYSITELNNATSYEIKVSAGRNGITDEQTIERTTADFVKPSTPTFSNVRFTSLTVSWTHQDAAGAPTDFALFRNGNFVTSLPVNINGIYSYTDTGRTPGQSYSYLVRARYAVANIDSAPSAQSTNSAVAPSQVTLSQSGSGNNTFLFSWTHTIPAGLSGLVTYRIERRPGTGSAGEWRRINEGTIAAKPTGSSQSWSSLRSQLREPLNANTTYRFRVVAIYEGGYEVEGPVLPILVR